MCFGRSAVDLIGQQHIREDRAFDKGPGAVPRGGVFLDDVGSSDVRRHQIRRELNAAEHQAQGLSQGSHQQRLGRARQTGDQAVAAHKQPDHYLFQHFILAHDHAPDLPDDFAFDLAKATDPALQIFCVQLRRH